MKSSNENNNDNIYGSGHQKKLMLAVEKLKRLSAVLLRHSASGYHRMTSPPPGADLHEDIQGQTGDSGTLKAASRRTRTPPTDNCCSNVVPINVGQSRDPVIRHLDDVATPTNERFVTSFGDDERTNTSPSRNYFGGADAHNGTVNVNGVCFSVYGTLPRNLIRRHAKQGQGEVQGRTVFKDAKLSDALFDPVRKSQRQPAPSPPKRTNSIKTDDQRPSENDIQSTLTRRHARKANSGECEVNENADGHARSVATPHDNHRWCSTTVNHRSLSLDDDDSEMMKSTDVMRRDTTTAAVPLLVDSTANGRQDDSASVNSDSSVVLGQEFDSGTVKHRQKCHVVSNSHFNDSSTTIVDLRSAMAVSLYTGST